MKHYFIDVTYSKHDRAVVRAENETEAREFAQKMLASSALQFLDDGSHTDNERISGVHQIPASETEIESLYYKPERDNASENEQEAKELGILE